jgi:hypothetical protein
MKLFMARNYPNGMLFSQVASTTSYYQGSTIFMKVCSGGYFISSSTSLKHPLAYELGYPTNEAVY